MTNMSGGASYDAIAHLYDRMYESEMGDGSREASLIANICSQYRPDASSILDLGAGTGRVLREITRIMSFDEMVGLELSEGMIDRAKQNVPEAEFIQGDITDFDLGRQFDVATCLSDTINHIPTPEGWESVFAHTAKHLKPGGIFMFDMATEHLLDGIAKLPDGYEWEFEGGRGRLTMSTVPPFQYRSQISVTPDRNPQEAATMEVLQTTFPPVAVIRSLKKCLKPVKTLDYNQALEHDGTILPLVTSDTTKIMIVAQKAVANTPTAGTAA